jgi:predicted metal-binding protein
VAGISNDFGQSNITKTRLGLMESYAHYFPKGHGRHLGIESVPEPRANEAIIFKDLFAAGLHMPLHLVLVDILCKFCIQLHHLTPNAIVQISKFIWAVTSCGGCPTANVFAQHYELHYQNKKIHLEGCETTLVAQFGCITLNSSRYGGRVKLTLTLRNKWTTGWDSPMKNWLMFEAREVIH